MFQNDLSSSLCFDLVYDVLPASFESSENSDTRDDESVFKQ